MTFILTMILGFYVSFDYLTHNYSITELFLLFPFFDIAVLYGLTCVAIGLKWLLMGRFKETVQPLWSLYIWKSDLIERLHNAFIGHWVLEPLMGTPFAAFFLRLLGVKIGKRSYIETSNGYLEYDLVTIGDDVALNHDCVLQSHLFEDRVFKAGPIKIENNCTIGAASEVLYNTVMKQNSTLGSLSLLMKGEQLPMNSRWQGVPAQAVYDQNNWQVKSEALDVASNSFIIETE